MKQEVTLPYGDSFCGPVPKREIFGGQPMKMAVFFSLKTRHTRTSVCEKLKGWQVNKGGCIYGKSKNQNQIESLRP